MAAANVTLAILQRNGLSVDEYFSKRLLEMIKLEKSNFVFTNLGVEMNLPRNEGTKTFTVRRYNHLPVGNHLLTEGVAPTALTLGVRSLKCGAMQVRYPQGSRKQR